MSHPSILKITVWMVLLCMTLQSCTQKNKRAEPMLTHEIAATDSRGQEIRLSAIASRVVVLFQPIVDEIYMLQAGEQIVGIPQQVYDNEDTFKHLALLDKRIANKTLPTPTYGGKATHIESVLALQPDLVIINGEDLETVAQLEDLGLPVFTVSTFDRKNIYNDLFGIATLLGKQARAMEILTYVDREIEAMKMPADYPVKSVYYAWSKGRVMSTSGRGTLIDLAIRTSGAVNACPLEMESPNIGAELMYKWNPNLIVLWNSDVADVYDLKELEALPAVQEKQVYNLTPAFYFDPHTVKFLQFAKQVRQWCYPELYTKEQFEKELEADMKMLYKTNVLINHEPN